MAQGRPIRIAIIADAGRAVANINRTNRALRDLERRNNRAVNDGGLSALDKAFSRIRKSAPAAIKTLVSGASVLSSFASLAGPATIAILAVTRALQQAAQWVGSLGPLVAFVPALAGGFALLKVSLTNAFSAMATQTGAVTTAFAKAKAEAGRLSTVGIRRLADDFARLNMPAIARGMADISVQTNQSVRAFGAWVNSAPGIRLIDSITRGTAQAWAEVAPAVTRAAIALGNMANRADIADRLTKLGGAVADIIDRFTRWADSVSAADITKALEQVGKATQFVRDKIRAVIEVIQWMADNQEKIRLFADALALVGIAFAALTGNVVGVVLGVLTLLLNHFDDVKKAVQGFAASWQSMSQSVAGNKNLMDFAAQLRVTWDQVTAALQRAWNVIAPVVVPALEDLGRVIVNDVVPALTRFLEAITPIVTWLIDKLAPVVAQVFAGIVQVIKGALQVIAGIINVITGIITLDWGRTWEGIKQIVSGVWNAISGVIRQWAAGIGGFISIWIGGVKARLGQAWEAIKSTVSTAWANIKTAISTKAGEVLAFIKTLPGKIKGALGNLGRLLYEAGADIIRGLLDGINSKVGAVTDKARSIAGSVKGAFSGALKIFSPSRVFRGFGRDTLDGYGLGLEDRFARIRSLLSTFAGTLGVDAALNPGLAPTLTPTGTGAAGQQVTLELASTGRTADDLILELIRRAIRVRGGDPVTVLGG